MLSFSVVKSAGSAGNYYTDKDNYYVLGSMGERWAVLLSSTRAKNSP